MEFPFDKLEALGVAAIALAILGAWIKSCLTELSKKDILLLDQEKYSRKRDESYVAALHTITDATKDLEKALAVLLERVK